MDKNRNQVVEPTLFGSVWRYRWLSLFIVILSLVAGVVLTATRPVSYVASASLVIEDPRTSTLFGSLGGTSPTRFLAEQVAMISSSAVAEQAAKLARENGASDMDVETIFEGMRITATGETNFVQIGFDSPDADTAVIGANAVADAYQATRRLQALESASSALNELNDKIAAITGDLTGIQTQIDSLRSAAEGGILDNAYDSAVRRLGELYTIYASTEFTDEARTELADLVDRIETLRLISTIELGSPSVTALLREQTAAIDRRSSLQSRRDEIEVDAELASTGVSLYSPALAAVETGSDLNRTLAVSLVLGGLLAVGIPVLLSSRDHGFTTRLEPESVLNAPLLAEIPNFKEEGIKSSLPARDVPRSLAAEGFRFAVTGVEMQMSARSSDDAILQKRRSVMVCSGAVGDGKTTVCANLAWSAARRGSRVLVIDADFGNQQLTEHLDVDGTDHAGLTDIVERGEHLMSALHTVELADGVHLDLLSRGGVAINVPDFFRSSGTQALFEAVAIEYDLVLIDSPPLLQVAYSSLIARYVDSAVVVVKHGTGRTLLEDVRDRLELIGTPILGYLYNQAPIRQELAKSEGSMLDVLGSP